MYNRNGTTYQRNQLRNPQQLSSQLRNLKATKLPQHDINKQQTIKTQIKSYKSIYDNVYSNRMQFFHRLSAVFAFMFTLIISIHYKSSLVLFPVKFLLIWAGYFILQQARTLSLTTEELKASNEFMRLISILISKKSLTLLTAILINSYIIFFILYCESDSSLQYYIDTPTKTIKPFLNDNFAFFCFYSLVSSIFYSLSFIAYEKYVLHITIGTFRQDPIDYLKKFPILKIFISSIIRSLILSLSIPLVYQSFYRNKFFEIFLKPLVILNDLNRSIPRCDFKYSTLFNLSFYSWLTFLSIDLLNELFNAYALIGCLVINKPISQLSNTPIQTLLSGLKDYKHQLVRLTSYQELVYLSTSEDFKDRQIFYRADNWTLVLAELFFVLTSVAKSSRYNLPTNIDNNNKNNFDELLKNNDVDNLRKEASLFGNLNNYKNNDLDLDFDLNNEKKENENKDQHDITIIKNDNDEIYPKRDANTDSVPTKKLSKFENFYNSSIIFLNEKFNNLNKSVNNLLINKFKFDPENLINNEQNSFHLKFSHLIKDLKKLVKFLFIGNLNQESNKRIPNKDIIGCAIISITEILIHAKTEDKLNSVTNTLTESLTLLTKVYKGTSEFLTNPPDYIKIDKSKDKNFSILIINELSISYFFKLVIYYNNILNDLILPPEVFKLAKWCTDMALEQQKDQKISNIL